MEATEVGLGLVPVIHPSSHRQMPSELHLPWKQTRTPPKTLSKRTSRGMSTSLRRCSRRCSCLSQLSQRRILDSSTSTSLVGTSCRRSDHNSHRPNLPSAGVWCNACPTFSHILPSSHSQIPKTLHIPWPLHVTGDEPEARTAKRAM